MKITFVLVLMISPGMMIMAQVPKKPATTTPAPAPALKTNLDSLSYAIGLSVAGFFKAQGIETVNTVLVSRAINDMMKNGKPRLNDQQANGVIMAYVQKVKEEKSAVNKIAGKSFLEANKTKPGVAVLPSGVQYLVLKEGSGPKPVATDKVKCHYEGSLIDGKVFESSVKNGQPIDFSVNGVIPGWTEALQLMPVGSKWRLFIPSNMAYGDNAQGPIPAGATLIFEVELLEILK